MKRLLLASLLCVVSMCAMAETHYKPHIWLGGRAGITLSQMSFSPSVKQLWNMGTAGAVTFRYSEEKIFGLIAEIGWVQRGWKENYEEAPFNYSRTLTYINIPLLTHIYFGTPRFKGFINLGPQFCFLLGTKINSDFDYSNTASLPDFPRNRMTEQLWAPVTNSFDYGICASVGMEFYVQPRHSVAVEGRFYYGLGNIFPSSKADTFSASRNMTIEVTLGYNFRLK